MSIRGLLVNYELETEINKVECSEIRAVNSSVEELLIYNPNIREPLHKFWYMIDNAKLDRKSSRGRLARIVVSSQDTNLIESIKSLDLRIDELVKKLFEKRKKKNLEIDQIVFESSITITSNFPPTMDVSLDNSSISLNSTGEQMDFMMIGNGSKIKILIELDRLIFERNVIRKMWRVIQIKRIEDITITADLFSSFEMETQVVQIVQPGQQTTSHPQPPPMPNVFRPRLPHPDSQNRISLEDLNTARLKPRVDDTEQKHRGFQPPTSDQLHDMIKKLKRSEKMVDDTKSTNLDDEDIDEHADMNDNVINTKASDVKHKNIIHLDASDSSDGSGDSDDPDDSGDSDDSGDPDDPDDSTDSESEDPLSTSKSTNNISKISSSVTNTINKKSKVIEQNNEIDKKNDDNDESEESFDPFDRSESDVKIDARLETNIKSKSKSKSDSKSKIKSPSKISKKKQSESIGKIKKMSSKNVRH